MKFLPSPKTILPGCVVALTLLCMTFPVRADDAIPKLFPPGHFDKMAARSPFSPPTAAVVAPLPVVQAGPKPFEKYTVALLMQQGNEYVATLNNKEDATLHTRVRTDKENDEGITLTSVQWSDNPSETKVTLRKGQEFGVVGFDPTGAPGVPGAMAARPNLRPVQPIAQFHPAPGVVSGTVPGGVQPPANNAHRQAVIRSAVQPVPIQPNVNGGVRPNKPPIPGNKVVIPGTTNDDDDD